MDMDSALKNANKLLSKIPIIIDGEQKYLEYTLYSIIKLDEVCGISLFNADSIKTIFPDLPEAVMEGKSEEELGNLVLKSLRPNLLNQLIWAGLVSAEPNLTLDEVAKRLKLADILTMISNLAKVQEGLVASLPAKDEQKKSLDEKAMEETAIQ